MKIQAGRTANGFAVLRSVFPERRNRRVHAFYPACVSHNTAGALTADSKHQQVPVFLPAGTEQADDLTDPEKDQDSFSLILAARPVRPRR